MTTTGMEGWRLEQHVVCGVQTELYIVLYLIWACPSTSEEKWILLEVLVQRSWLTLHHTQRLLIYRGLRPCNVKQINICVA